MLLKAVKPFGAHIWAVQNAVQRESPVLLMCICAVLHLGVTAYHFISGTKCSADADCNHNIVRFIVAVVTYHHLVSTSLFGSEYLSD